MQAPRSPSIFCLFHDRLRIQQKLGARELAKLDARDIFLDGKLAETRQTELKDREKLQILSQLRKKNVFAKPERSTFVTIKNRSRNTRQMWLVVQV